MLRRTACSGGRRESLNAPRTFWALHVEVLELHAHTLAVQVANQIFETIDAHLLCVTGPGVSVPMIM
jgi:hypothetical protein